MTFSKFASLVVVAAWMAACSGSTAHPVSPSAAAGSSAVTAGQLSGTWSLVAIQPAGQPEQVTPGGASYSLTLADGRLSTRADCNMCSGAYTLGTRTITAGPALACTRAACATMAFENTYTSILSGESTVAIADGTLTLSSPRGVLRFTR